MLDVLGGIPEHPALECLLPNILKFDRLLPEGGTRSRLVAPSVPAGGTASGLHTAAPPHSSTQHPHTAAPAHAAGLWRQACRQEEGAPPKINPAPHALAAAQLRPSSLAKYPPQVHTKQPPTAIEHHKNPADSCRLALSRQEPRQLPAAGWACWLGPLGPSPSLCHAPHLQPLPARRGCHVQSGCAREE